MKTRVLPENTAAVLIPSSQVMGIPLVFTEGQGITWGLKKALQ